MGFVLVTVKLSWFEVEDGRRPMKLEDRPDGGVARNLLKVGITQQSAKRDDGRILRQLKVATPAQLYQSKMEKEQLAWGMGWLMFLQICHGSGTAMPTGDSSAKQAPTSDWRNMAIHNPTTAFSPPYTPPLLLCLFHHRIFCFIWPLSLPCSCEL